MEVADRTEGTHKNNTRTCGRNLQSQYRKTDQKFNSSLVWTCINPTYLPDYMATQMHFRPKINNNEQYAQRVTVIVMKVPENNKN